MVDEKHTCLTNRQKNRLIRTREALQHPLWQQLYENNNTKKGGSHKDNVTVHPYDAQKSDAQKS